MIADFFLRIAYWFAAGLIGMFPQSSGFPPEAHSAMQTLGGYFGMFSPIIPMGTFA